MYEGLCNELKLNEARLQQILSAMVNHFHLLKENKTHIWSERVLANFKQRRLKSMKRAEAGRVGGIISGQKRSKMKQVLQANEANEAKERKGKERKGNEIKEEKKAPEVHLSDDDFLKSLKTNKAYHHINVDFELGKIDAYLSVHPGKQKTRRFIVAWLNRIDRPLAAAPIQASRKPKANPKCDVCGGTGKLKDHAGAQCFCVV